MDRPRPTYAAELEARRRKREAERRKNLRRARAIVVLLVVFVVSAGAVLAWFLAGPRAARYEPVLSVDFPSPVDLIVPSIVYAKEYAAHLPPPEPPGPKPLVPAPGVKTIVLDKSEQIVTLYRADGTAVDRFQCASGHTYPRVGTYKVTSRKEASSYPADGSRFFHFVIFTQSDKGTNIGFHSIPIDKAGKPIGGLGKPESHGCVRLANEKAEFVYGWAPNGTKVIVKN